MADKNKPFTPKQVVADAAKSELLNQPDNARSWTIFKSKCEAGIGFPIDVVRGDQRQAQANLRFGVRWWDADRKENRIVVVMGTTGVEVQ
jgi:hypothetical protein